MRSVSGLKWGNYVGSPEHQAPQLVWTETYSAPVASLVALPTGGVFGIGHSSSLLVMYSKEKGRRYTPVLNNNTNRNMCLNIC